MHHSTCRRTQQMKHILVAKNQRAGVATMRWKHLAAGLVEEDPEAGELAKMKARVVSRQEDRGPEGGLRREQGTDPRSYVERRDGETKRDRYCCTCVEFHGSSQYSAKPVWNCLPPNDRLNYLHLTNMHLHPRQPKHLRDSCQRHLHERHLPKA